ncbi:MAG: TIM barrel protein [Steroidobacteraceae bacterium]
MNRRALLRGLTSLAGLAAAGTFGAVPSGGSRGGVQPGVQLFPVRSLLEKDVSGTLTVLAGIGFTEVEMFGIGGASIFASDAFFGMQPNAFIGLVKKLGMRIPTVHFSGGEAGVPKAAEIALSLGATHLINPMASIFQQRSPDGLRILPVRDEAQMQRLAEDLNRAGEASRKAGIRFAYHNHHMEFAPLGARRPFDILLAQTDPALVDFELDVGWAVAAGADPASYLERFPTRFVACHLKDYDPKRPVSAPSSTAPIPEMVRMVPPGDGTIDFPRILAAMRHAGIGHGYLEVDLPQGNPLDVCRRGYQYLSRL